MKTMTISEARNGLLGMAEEMKKNPREIVKVAKRGKDVLTIISSEMYDSLMETLDILSDQETAALLIEAVRHPKKARHSLQQVEKELGL